MKIEELRDFKIVEGEAVSPSDEVAEDLTNALGYLNSCAKLLGFLSDKRLSGKKLSRKNREAFAELHAEVSGFLGQWEGLE